MGDSATAMRDPVFYRWHAHIDDLFQEHKRRLAPYTDQQLNYQGIRVTGISVQPVNGRTNIFNTFWQQSDVSKICLIKLVPSNISKYQIYCST